MTSRPSTILARFPSHLEADAPGKRFGAVVGSLATDLDTQTVQLGDVRRSHRLRDAPTLDDLLRLATLHGLRSGAFDPVRLRLAAAGTGAPARAVAQHRRTVAALIAVHRDGNGTPSGILRAAAAYLGLDVEHLDDADDRWWHLATCGDLLADLEGAPAEEDEPPDLLALEENPFRAADVEPSTRRHGALFAVLRGGLEAVPVTVVVLGVEDRTVAPMVVDVDTGCGLVFTGAVPAGSALRFWADGRVTLDDASVAPMAHSFRGAVFADVGASHSNDFVFADAADPPGGDPPRPVAGDLPHHVGSWSVTGPIDDAFGPVPSSRPDGPVEPLWLRRGRSRWRAFAGTGSYAGGGGGGTVVLPAPSHAVGSFDGSVFAVEPATPAPMRVGFEWQEREPFAVRLWIPARFEALDRAGEAPVRELLRTLLDRHRAAGVRLTVAYADPRWTLGTGIVRDLGATDPRGVVVSGTAAWSDDTTQPSPDPANP